MSLIKIINFKDLGDERGGLIAIEENSSVPFSIQRVYYIFGTKADSVRGFHAHRNLKQVAICVSGGCRFVLDNGNKREEVVLDEPNKGLIIEDLTWREMHDFSDDCVLLVLASELFDESDYIRDYDEFLQIIDE